MLKSRSRTTGDMPVTAVSSRSSGSSKKPPSIKSPSLKRTLSTPPSTTTPKRGELSSLKKIIKEDRTGKDRAIIAVVSQDQVAALERKIYTSKWKFWAGKNTVRVTTPDSLQSAIDLAQGDKNGARNLTILVSEELDTLEEFHVGATIRNLSIFRHEDVQLGPPVGALLIPGSCTFGKTRLDRWQFKKHQSHNIYLGNGVGIALDAEVFNVPVRANGGGNGSNEIELRNRTPRVWGNQCSLTLTDAERGEVYQLFNSLHQSEVSGTGTEQPWWERWQKPISLIIGILTGNKSGHTMRATVGGLYVEFNFGAAVLSAGAAGIPQIIQMAAGPASMLGVGAAAAAYFLPWEAIMTWLWNIIKSLFRNILAIFETLMRWVASKFKGQSRTEGPPLPMGFI